MGQPPVPCLGDEAPPNPGGAACFPPCAPRDPPGPAPAAATAAAVQAGRRQSRGGDGPWAGQRGCGSVPSPARPLSCSGTGWAGRAGSAAARSPPLPAAPPSAQAAPGGEADASAEPPPGAPSHLPRCTLASLAVFEQPRGQGPSIHVAERGRHQPGHPRHLAQPGGVGAESAAAPSRPQVQLGVPRHPSPSRQESCCSTSVGTCHRHLVPEPGQGPVPALEQGGSVHPPHTLPVPHRDFILHGDFQASCKTLGRLK